MRSAPTRPRVRLVLVRQGRGRLQGEVEVYESYIVGEELGRRGGGAMGKKVMVGVAVERSRPRGFGHFRMPPLVDASADSLRAFLVADVEPGAIVVTDGWVRTGRRLGSCISTAGFWAQPGKWRPGCSPACTRSPRSPSGGCSAATKGLSGRSTCPVTQRGRISLQPPPIAQPRTGLLRCARARRRPRPRALWRPHR